MQAPITGRSASSAAGLILTFLLMGTTLRLVSAQPTFTYLVTPGADYPGNDIRPSPGPASPAVCNFPLAYGENATACEARCNATAECGGFVIRPADNCCYIKSRMLNPTVVGIVVAHVKAPLGVTYTVQNATDYPGNDIVPLPLSGPTIYPPICGTIGYSESAAACEIRCNAVDACVAYEHNPNVNCCFLKSALGPPSANAFINTNIKNGYPGYYFEPNRDYLGFAIAVPAGVPTSNVCVYPSIVGITTGVQTQAIIENAAACLARCNSTAGCIAISHYPGPNCCFLKSTISPLSPPTLSISSANFYSKKAPVPCSGPAAVNCATVQTPTFSSVCGCTVPAVGNTSFCSPAVQCSACQGCNSDADCPIRYSCGNSCGGVAPTATKGLCFPNCGNLPANGGAGC